MGPRKDCWQYHQWFADLSGSLQNLRLYLLLAFPVLLVVAKLNFEGRLEH